MVRAVVEDHPEIDHRVAGEVAAQARLLDAFFHGGYELPRDRAAEGFVHELELAAARQWLHANLAVAKLAMAAGLFLVAPVGLDLGGDGLAVRDAGRLQQHVDAEAAFQLGHGHFDMQLPLSGQQQFMRLRVALVTDGAVLFLEAVHRGADLVFVAAALGLDGVRQHRFREGDRCEGDAGGRLGQRVVGARVFQLGDRPQVAGLQLGDVGGCLALHHDQVAEPLGLVLRQVVDGGVGLEHALVDPEHGDASGELIGDGLPHEGRVRGRVVGRPRHRLAAGERGKGPLRRRRQVGQHGVEQRLHADVLQPRGADQREDLGRAGGRGQPFQQLILRERAGVEEVLHQ